MPSSYSPVLSLNTIIRCNWPPSAVAVCPSPRSQPFQRKAQTRGFHRSLLDSSRRLRPRAADLQHSSVAWPVRRQAFSASANKAATKDPYKTLGVGKNSAASEIKKAYYTLAKKYHPDTNKDATAKERFSEAQSAYEILQDPKKKEMWDQYGAAAFDQGAGFDPRGASASGGNPFAGAGAGGPFQGFGGGFGAEFNFEDLFGAFTGQGRRSRGAGAGGGGRQSSSPFETEEILVGENIEVQTNISFMDAAKGVAKDIYVTPLVTCDTCKGKGMRKGTQRQSCSACKGTGTKVHFMQQGFQMASTCDACGGQGISIPRGSECSSCSGNGVVRQRKTVHVDIPGGVEDGMRLRVGGEGDAAPTGMASNPNSRSSKGDLYVFIRVAPDSRFSRNGADILHTATIPLTTALLGGQVTIPTLDNDVKVKVATGTGTGDRVTLGGMGMRRLGGGRRAGSGDLKVEFKVSMPKYLNSSQRTILEMLADEMGDKTAKRIMNVGQYQQQQKPSTPSQPPSSPPKTNTTTTDQAPSDTSSNKASAHQNEGFFKSAWHKLTHQHDNLEPDSPSAGENQQQPSQKEGPATTKVTDQNQNQSEARTESQDETPKKASGSA